MAFRFFIITLLLNISTCFSQVPDSLLIQNTLSKDTITVQNDQVKDSLIDGLPHRVDSLSVSIDSLSVKNLQDLEIAAKYDEEWYEELYSNALFDTIHKTVTELDFEPVDYPELHTDTLKARLKELDARTPFNVEYNPSLEIVIKSYLKNRRKHLQKLITLSAFYFPMFETELD